MKNALEEKTLEKMQTQGKAGEKLPRMSIAFAPENLEYVRIMAKIKGFTTSQFVNSILARDLRKNEKAFTSAKQLVEEMEEKS